MRADLLSRIVRIEEDFVDQISHPRRKELSSIDLPRFSHLLIYHLFQAHLTIVLSDNLVALTGGVFKFLAVHDLHCATVYAMSFLFCKTPLPSSR